MDIVQLALLLLYGMIGWFGNDVWQLYKPLIKKWWDGLMGWDEDGL